MTEINIDRPAEGILRVTLNRPEALNAFTFAMYERLAAICDEANRYRSIKVLVLQGAGDVQHPPGMHIQAQGPQVSVVNSQNRVELRKVTLGRDFGNTIEILSGISQPDAVIANPPDYLVDGMPVSVQTTQAGGK